LIAPKADCRFRCRLCRRLAHASQSESARSKSPKPPELPEGLAAPNLAKDVFLRLLDKENDLGRRHIDEALTRIEATKDKRVRGRG